MVFNRPVTQNSQTDAKHFNGLSLEGKQTHTGLHYNPTAISKTIGDGWNKSLFCGVNERATAKIMETDLRKRKNGSLLLSQKHSRKENKGEKYSDSHSQNRNVSNDPKDEGSFQENKYKILLNSILNDSFISLNDSIRLLQCQSNSKYINRTRKK